MSLAHTIVDSLVEGVDPKRMVNAALPMIRVKQAIKAALARTGKVEIEPLRWWADHEDIRRYSVRIQHTDEYTRSMRKKGPLNPYDQQGSLDFDLAFTCRHVEYDLASTVDKLTDQFPTLVIEVDSTSFFPETNVTNMRVTVTPR